MLLLLARRGRGQGRHWARHGQGLGRAVESRSLRLRSHLSGHQEKKKDGEMRSHQKPNIKDKFLRHSTTTYLHSIRLDHRGLRRPPTGSAATLPHSPPAAMFPPSRRAHSIIPVSPQTIDDRKGCGNSMFTFFPDDGPSVAQEENGMIFFVFLPKMVTWKSGSSAMEDERVEGMSIRLSVRAPILSTWRT